MVRRENKLKAELGRLRRDMERAQDGSAVDCSQAAIENIRRQIGNIQAKMKEYGYTA